MFSELVGCTRKICLMFLLWNTFWEIREVLYGQIWIWVCVLHWPLCRQVIHLFTIKDYKPIVCHCLVMIVYWVWALDKCCIVNLIIEQVLVWTCLIFNALCALLEDYKVQSIWKIYWIGCFWKTRKFQTCKKDIFFFILQDCILFHSYAYLSRAGNGVKHANKKKYRKKKYSS